MKKIIIIIVSIFSFSVAVAQEENPIVETSFKVEGVCNMCKERIEGAALRAKGVKQAEWDKVSKELKVVYNSRKTTEEEIHQSVAAKGHQTAMIEVDSVAYQKLPGCCRYKDGAKCSH
jgi:copper chaperone CopZ